MVRVDNQDVVVPGAVGFPADHRELVGAYGTGVFEGLLWLLAPRSRNQHLDLEHQTRVQLDALRQLRDRGEPLRYDIDTPDGHLIAWGLTDNGDVTYWRREPGAPTESWTVAVNEARGPRWFAFDGTATEFLLGVMSRRVNVDIFPGDFPSDEPTFRPAR